MPASAVERDTLPPPPATGAGWEDVRRVLALYGFMLGSGVAFAVLRALEVAAEPVIDAWLSLVGALVVASMVLLDRRRIVAFLGPARVTLHKAGRIALAAAATVAALELYFFVLVTLGVPFLRFWPPFEQAGWPLWSAFLLIAVAPGVVEELAFRGLIYETLRGVMARREALLVQAMAFSVLHLSPWVFASHFLIGLSLGLLRDSTRSLYPCMLAHAGWNAWVLAQDSGIV